MVNVSFGYGLLASFIIPMFFLTKHMYRRYRRDISVIHGKRFRNSESGDHVKLKNYIPRLKSYHLYLYFMLIAVLSCISLYIYFDGNVEYNRFRNFKEDDDTGDEDYIRGAVVFSHSIIGLIVWIMSVKWFFQWECYKKAMFGVLLCTIIDIPILWAMPTTHRFRGDSFKNRFWLAFALWLIKTILQPLFLWMAYQWNNCFHEKHKMTRNYLNMCHEKRVAEKRSDCDSYRKFS